MGEMSTGKRFNIGVDVDGVLSNFTLAARTLLKEMFDGKPSDDLIQTSWAFESLGITVEEENKMWRRIDTIPNWWLGHQAMPDTDLLPQLCEKHRVIFITNRKDGTGMPIEDQTKLWLKRTFGIVYTNVVISDMKGPISLGLKLDYFIDDRPKNVYEVEEEAPGVKAYMLDATYNQGGPEVDRVSSFNSFAWKIMTEAQ